MSHAMPEALCLENEVLSVRILPGRGGKVASLYSKREQFELLYQPLHGYPALQAGMPFSATPWGFLIVILLSVAVSIIAAIVLSKKRFF